MRLPYTLPLDQLPDPLPIEPLRKPFDVTITPPGSKSITCRAYVLAALADGESQIIRPLRADDTEHLLKALCALGAEARWEGEDVYIKGVRGRFPRGGNLYMGDGGAPTRFMIACACLAAEPVTIDASPRMRERPIAEGVEMLRQLGAKIEYVEEQGRLPVRVVPSMLRGATIHVNRAASSQFISAMFLIAPCIVDGVLVEFHGYTASATYLELTWDTIARFDALSEYDSDETVFKGDAPSGIGAAPLTMSVTGSGISSCEFIVEPDASSAVYWVLAATLTPGSRVLIPGLDGWSMQPDVQILYALKSREVDVDFEFHQDDCGSTTVRGGVGSLLDEFDARATPDGAVALAATACEASAATRLTGLRTLRVKETDRIAALANELRKVGCAVETGEDWIEITPPSARAEPAAKGIEQGPVVIETYNDHRMAMAFAVLGLARPGISIRNPACVKKSYPGFWKDFAKLYGH